jgi:hypothetical protein
MGLKMQYKTIIKSIIFVLLATTYSVSAENISVPYSFNPGTTISSAEMNKNFTVLQEGINRQAESLSTVDSGLAQVKQNSDENGVKLDDINSVLSDMNVYLESIDTKLTTLSPTSVSDQLICSVPSVSGFVAGTYQATCLQQSLPNATKLLNLTEIYSEGWVTQSMSYYGLTFVK